MKMRNLQLISLSLVFFASLLSAKVVDKTIAVVNGEAILLSEYEKITNPIIEQYKMSAPDKETGAEKITELKKKVLDQMIDDRVLKQEAVKQGVKVTKRDLEEGMSQIKKRFPSEADFQSELKKENITQADFEKKIKEQLMVMKLTEQEIKSSTEKPSDEEVSKFFGQIKQKMEGKNLGLDKDAEEEIAKLATFFKKMTSEQVRASHILITVDKNASMKDKTAALNRIKEAKKKIDSGESFAKVAEEYSQDPGSGKKGGDLGYFAKGDMVPEFEKAAFDLKVGAVSSPVLSDFGYHLIKVEERKASRTLSIDDVKEDLQQYIYQKNAQKKYENWIKNLRSKAAIKINEME